MNVVCVPEQEDLEEVMVETERLILRRINPANEDDVTFIQNLLTDDSWSSNICPMPDIAENRENARLYIINRPVKMYRESRVGSWLVVRREDQQRLGIGGLILRSELAPLFDLGFALLPKFHRQGYGEELCRGVLRWASETLHVSTIAAVTNSTNVAALGLLGKLGFTLREHDPHPLWWGSPQAVLHLELRSKGQPAADS